MPLQNTDNLVIARDGVNYKMPATGLKEYLLGNAEVGTAPPEGAELGTLWWNTTTGRLNIFNGTAWVDASPEATVVQTIFPGMVSYTAAGAAPVGWLKANGAAINRTTYADLFAAIGTTYGAGNGSTTFNLPDLRGEFIRGWDEGRGADPGRTFASFQGQSFLSHGHGVNDPTHAHGVFDPGHAHVYNRTDATTNAPANLGLQYFALTGLGQPGVGTSASGTGIGIFGAGTGISIQANGGSETRPRNVALLPIIKF